jgi:V/A-type H+/Na+-transporting ATPase subunit I
MIVSMKRVAVLAAQGEAEAALRRLRKLGVVHVVPSREPAAADLAGIEAELARLERALALLGPDPAGKAAAPAAVQGDGRSVVDVLLDLASRREEARAKLREAEEKRAWFKAWGDPSWASIRELAEAGLAVRLYQADARALKRLPESGLAVVAGRDKGRVRLAWLTPVGGEGLDLREETIPKVEVAGIEAEIDRCRAELARMEEEERALAARRGEFRAYGRRLARSRELARVRAGLGREDSFVFLEGYCPAESVERLSREAAERGWGLLASEPDDPSEVPTLIRNPGWVRAIEPLFKFMGTLPGYAEADVSLWFLGFLSLFFAMLIGDGGYGLLFLAGALLARRKAKPGTPPDIYRLLILFSGTTIVWGALTGTWFGMPALAKLPVLRSLVVPRLDSFVEANSAFLMYLCFMVGLAHLTLAHLINLVRLWPSPRLLGQAGWIAIVWSVFFLVGSVVSGRPMPGFFMPLLLGGIGLALVFGNFQRNVLKGMAATLVNLPLSVIGTFSDMMSYLRLFAVGFASLTVADSFNRMALGSGVHSLPQALLAAVVLLFGHALNLVLGGMSVLVHGVRLNMLEFSSHLGQEWTGLRYEPFRETPDEGRGRNLL